MFPSPSWFGLLTGAHRCGSWDRHGLDDLMLVDQGMVTSHTYAHRDFFKNNQEQHAVEPDESKADDLRKGEPGHENPALLER